MIRQNQLFKVGVWHLVEITQLNFSHKSATVVLNRAALLWLDNLLKSCWTKLHSSAILFLFVVFCPKAGL